MLDLNKFPNLKLAFGDGYLSDPKGKEFQRQLLAGESASQQELRIDLEECLAFAYARKGSHNEPVTDLRYVEREEIISEIYNLKIQCFLDGMGYTTRKEPELVSGAKPDLEVSLPGSEHPPLLVEIKTLFASAEDTPWQNWSDNVFALLKQIPKPYSIRLMFTEWQRGFDPTDLRDWVVEQLELLDAWQTIEPVDESPLLSFHDEATNATALVRISPLQGDFTHTAVSINKMPPYSANQGNRLWNILEESVRQLSLNSPNIIILTAGYMPIPDWDLVDAIFGSLSTSIDSTTRDWRWIRQRDGFFSTDRNRLISAVGLYEERWSPTSGASPVLTVFHNPYAELPLSPKFFHRDGITQIAEERGDDGVVRLSEV